MRITYPNLLHGNDFFCFLFKNYSWNWEGAISCDITHLFLDHKFMTLHHQFKFIPSCLQLTNLFQATTCYRAQQFVLWFSFVKQRVNLQKENSISKEMQVVLRLRRTFWSISLSSFRHEDANWFMIWTATNEKLFGKHFWTNSSDVKPWWCFYDEHHYQMPIIASSVTQKLKCETALILE